MKIGEQTIVTPIDNPCQFEPDWRNSVAVALFDNPGYRPDPEYSMYVDDPWIKRQIDYLSALKHGRRLNPAQMNMRMASVWYQGTRPSDVKYRLEPLLLTAVNYSVISLDIGGGTIDEDAFVAYEKMYFNVRLDNGRLHPSCQLRQYFALPSGEMDDETPPEQLWKMIGALMGYDTLTSIWLWKDAHGKRNDSQEYMLDEMWRVAQSRVFMSMFEGRIGHESMAKLLSALTSQTKMLKESKESGETGLDTTRTLMAILYKASPQVIGAAKDVDAQPAMMRAIKETLEAEAAIEKTALPAADTEAANAELNKLIASKF